MRVASIAMLLAACRAAPGAPTRDPTPAVAAAPRPGDALAELQWLAGTWTAQTGGGPVTEETWTAARDGTMLGVNQKTRGGGPPAIALLRIDARDGETVYTAVPPGRATTSFVADAIDGDAVVFENRGHDSPHRISYTRVDASHVDASIAVDAGDPAARWSFERSGDPARLLRQPGRVAVVDGGAALEVEIPGGYCAQLLCVVVPTAEGRVLQVAVLDTSSDCTAPAKGRCPAPSDLAGIPLGDTIITFLYRMD